MAHSTDDPGGRRPKRPDPGYEILPDDAEPDERYGPEVRRRQQDKIDRQDRRHRRRNPRPVGTARLVRALGILCAIAAAFYGLSALTVVVVVIAGVVDGPLSILQGVGVLLGLAVAPAWAYSRAVADNPELERPAWVLYQVVLSCYAFFLLAGIWLTCAGQHGGLSPGIGKVAWAMGLWVLVGAVFGRTAWQAFTGRLTEASVSWTMLCAMILAGLLGLGALLRLAQLAALFMVQPPAGVIAAWLGIFLLLLVATAFYGAIAVLARVVRRRI